MITGSYIRTEILYDPMSYIVKWLSNVIDHLKTTSTGGPHDDSNLNR